MLPFLEKLSNGAVPMMLGDAIAADVVVSCQGYTAGCARGTFTVVAGSDTRGSAVRWTAAGILRLYDATAALPAGAITVDGVAVSSTGQLCVTTGAPASDATFLMGMAVRNDGAVHISDMTPAAWYRYAQGQTIAGGGVSVWADRSGNSRDMAGSVGQRPVVQTDGSLLFDGVDDVMKPTGFTLNQPVSVYLLMKQVTWTADDFIIDGDTQDTMVIYQNLTTPRLRAYAGAFSAENANLAVGAYGVVQGVFNGASSVLQVDATTAITGNFGATNPGGITLGAGGSSAIGWSNIQVKEVIVFNAAHSATQREFMRAYLGRLA